MTSASVPGTVTFSGLYGVGGIALANAIAFTVEAVFLFFLLNRKVPGFFRSIGTAFRALAAGAVAAGVVLLVNTLADTAARGTLTGFAIGAAALLVGLAAGLPLIWREVRALVRI